MTFNLNHDAAYDAGLICGGTLEIFVEPILPPPVLYLFGGGHVSTAVARVAAPAGFVIGIIDDRETFANRERFPMARKSTPLRRSLRKNSSPTRRAIW